MTSCVQLKQFYFFKSKQFKYSLSMNESKMVLSAIEMKRADTTLSQLTSLYINYVIIQIYSLSK